MLDGILLQPLVSEPAISFLSSSSNFEIIVFFQLIRELAKDQIGYALVGVITHDHYI